VIGEQGQVTPSYHWSHGMQFGRPPNGWTDLVWLKCSHGDVGLLCSGETQPLVYIGICRVMRNGIGLWVSSGSLAVRVGGIGLVPSSGQALVDREGIRLTFAWPQCHRCRSQNQPERDHRYVRAGYYGEHERPKGEHDENDSKGS
jgi:hypothetical protein